MSEKKQSPKRLRWYAVRCENSRSVVKAGVAIARLGVPVFIPKAFRQERRGKWLVAVENGLLFPPYLFIAMRAPGSWSNLTSTIWGKVAEADGVKKIMGCRDKAGDPVPVPVPHREMRKIRTKHSAGERKKIAERFKKDQKVKILKGAFEGFDGIFDMPVKERVRILVSLFGHKTVVELDERDIRAA